MYFTFDINYILSVFIYPRFLHFLYRRALHPCCDTGECLSTFHPTGNLLSLIVVKIRSDQAKHVGQSQSVDMMEICSRCSFIDSTQ